MRHCPSVSFLPAQPCPLRVRSPASSLRPPVWLLLADAIASAISLPFPHRPAAEQHWAQRREMFARFADPIVAPLLAAGRRCEAALASASTSDATAPAPEALLGSLFPGGLPSLTEVRAAVRFLRSAAASVRTEPTDAQAVVAPVIATALPALRALVRACRRCRSSLHTAQPAFEQDILQTLLDAFAALAKALGAPAVEETLRVLLDEVILSQGAVAAIATVKQQGLPIGATPTAAKEVLALMRLLHCLAQLPGATFRPYVAAIVETGLTHTRAALQRLQPNDVDIARCGFRLLAAAVATHWDTVSGTAIEQVCGGYPWP